MKKFRRRNVHNSTSWHITIEPALVKVVGNVSKLLLKRQVIECLSDGKLAVDCLLRDAKVLHIEKTFLAYGGD
jgi:hypothetical protein